MSPRPWEPREHRLVAEWVAATFPKAHLMLRVRLGALDPALTEPARTKGELAALGVFRRWVDAVVLEPDRVHLVEGKIRNAPGAIEQLALYDRLFPLTPEFQHLRHLPRELHLVRVVEDPAVEALARERGIRVHTIHPPWVDEYLLRLTPRARAGTTASVQFGGPEIPPQE